MDTKAHLGRRIALSSNDPFTAIHEARHVDQFAAIDAPGTMALQQAQKAENMSVRRYLRSAFFRNADGSKAGRKQRMTGALLYGLKKQDWTDIFHRELDANGQAYHEAVRRHGRAFADRHHAHQLTGLFSYTASSPTAKRLVDTLSKAQPTAQATRTRQPIAANLAKRLRSRAIVRSRKPR